MTLAARWIAGWNSMADQRRFRVVEYVVVDSIGKADRGVVGDREQRQVDTSRPARRPSTRVTARMKR